MSSLEQRAINTIRFLAVDAVEKANSGHPGLPMGAAPMAYVLWTKFLRHNPRNPGWFDRDRFILSAGHGSMLLYALLHLTGYDLPIEELQNFRQWDSRTAGHPEYHWTVGVETTTGPLGQGAANAVGMAMAEAFLAAKYNLNGQKIVDHYTYALVSDGDLMEGVSAEAASLAGHFKLGKLIYLYDDNKISLAAPTDVTFTEDVGKRFEAYGWHVLRVADGNDTAAIEAAIKAAQAERERPSIIMVRTIIGYGSPNKANTYEVHGSPLGKEETRLTKQQLGWDPDAQFLIPDEVRQHFQQVTARGQQQEAEWQQRWQVFQNDNPEVAAELARAIRGELPTNWDAAVPVFEPDTKGEATRVSSGKVINAIAKNVPTFMGGDADLAPSTKTTIKGEGNFGVDGYGQRNIPYGVREHAMAGITNGMAVHGGMIKPYCATFFTFSDYMRPSVRLAALMSLKNIFVYTHDSIGLGEDGPTHQPVEHLAAMRAIPNLVVYRPGDANETAAAWKAAMLHQHGPVALVFSRQNLPILSPDIINEDGVRKGGYVLSDSDGSPQAVIMATGSEVSIALEAQEKLRQEGIQVRVVSLPSLDQFETQDQSYIDSIIPPNVTARVVVEAGIRQGWDRYLQNGRFIGVGNRFGASAPAEVIYEKLGITPEAVATAVKDQL